MVRLPDTLSCPGARMTDVTVQNRVDSVIASAGTGKTYRLVEEIVAAVIDGLEPHRVLATTFTNKAAAELIGRVRAQFICRNRPDLAAAMLTARIGTVNSVCGSLIAEFAFELGRSPVAEVIPDERRVSIFARATGAVMEEFAPAIADLAERLSIPPRDRQLAGRAMRGWLDDVRRIVDLARLNGVASDRLPTAAVRSSTGLLALLGSAQAGEIADSLDQTLADAVRTCCAAVGRDRAILKATTIDGGTGNRARRADQLGRLGPACQARCQRRQGRSDALHRRDRSRRRPCPPSSAQDGSLGIYSPCVCLRRARVGAVPHAAVQLNEPAAPGSENALTGIGEDPDGFLYLLRQADLHENRMSGRIRGGEFAKRTGLAPVAVTVGRRLARRQWYVVTTLDSGRAIRAETADFVSRCWSARTGGKGVARDRARLADLFGKPERGGWHELPPNPFPRAALRAQGYVYEALEEVLSADGIPIGKPRHADGYEVDAVIGTPNGPLLVEIKTTTSPADVYCGVGQLTLYPLVLPDLARHTRVLLLPGEARPALVAALRGADVELHHYRLNRRRRRPDIRFSAIFLRRCGVAAERFASLGAY